MCRFGGYNAPGYVRQYADISRVQTKKGERRIRNRNIRLDPEVIEEQRESKVPLSDLYGLPVFSENTSDRAGKLEIDEKMELKQIRAGIFTADVGKEEACIGQIRGQVFQTAAGFTRMGGTEKTAGEESAEEGIAESASERILLAGMMVFCIVLLLFIFQRNILKKEGTCEEKVQLEKRKEDVDDIDDYCR